MFYPHEECRSVTPLDAARVNRTKNKKNVRWVVETHDFATCWKNLKNVSCEDSLRLKERWIAIAHGVTCTWYVQVDSGIHTVHWQKWRIVHVCGVTAAAVGRHKNIYAHGTLEAAAHRVCVCVKNKSKRVLVCTAAVRISLFHGDAFFCSLP